MREIEVRFDKKVKRLFGDNLFYKDFCLQHMKYFNSFMELDESINIEDIINFINKNESFLIDNLMKNTKYKIEVLTRDGIVYWTEVDKINANYLRKIFYNIKKHNFGSDELNTLLEIIKFINLYGLDNHNTNIILNNRINLIVDNPRLVGDGDTLISEDEQLKKTDILLRWNSKCDNKILDHIFLLELLYERIKKLLSSNSEELTPYKAKLNEMLKVCDLAIKVRDENVDVTDDIKKQINNLFEEYELINKRALIELISGDEYNLVHFVPTDEVNYQIIQNEVIDVAKKANIEYADMNEDKQRDYKRCKEMDTEEQDKFIRSYIKECKRKIEKRYPITIKIFKNFYSKKMSKYLLYYNNIFNNFPLTRISMNIPKFDDTYMIELLSPTNNDFSCSLISSDSIYVHRRRTVGVSIVPINESSFKSINPYYTKNIFEYDFRRDSVPYIEVIERLENENGVNETVLDATKCIVKSVIVTSDDPNSLMRAEHLSKSYGVPIEYYLESKKSRRV